MHLTGNSPILYRTWRNIGVVKDWQMPPYETFGGNKLANHNRYIIILRRRLYN